MTVASYYFWRIMAVLTTMAVADALSMLWLMSPVLGTVTDGYSVGLTIIMGVVIRGHYHVTFAPFKGTKKEIYSNVYASIPIEMDLWAAIHSSCHVSGSVPITGWVVLPMPVAINLSGIVIGQVDNLSLYWLYDDVFLYPPNAHIL